MFGVKKTGGERVGDGSYWNFSTGDRVYIDGTGVLPGDGKQVYYKLPPAVVLVLGPVLGLAYAVFLPLIGIAMLVAVLAEKIFGGVVEIVSKGAIFNWRPGEAYLGGKAGKRKKGKEKREQ